MARIIKPLKDIKIKNASKNTFKLIALELFNHIKDDISPKFQRNTTSRIEKEINLFIDERIISELTNQDYLAVLKRIEAGEALETLAML